jgi:hypothetical protein
MSAAEQQKPFVTGGVIDGKAVAAAIREETAATVRLLKEKHGKVSDSWPGAAVGSSGVSFLLTTALQSGVLWHHMHRTHTKSASDPFMPHYCSPGAWLGSGDRG